MIFSFLGILLQMLFHTGESNDLISKLESITPSSQHINISNDLKIAHKGGHLQGIQVYPFGEEDYIYVSGSSRRYGYLVAASSQKVEKLHILREKPLKHAGGFQIHDNWLAVGIEDNELRNVSEVHVYQLDNPKADQLRLKGIVNRKGNWERATAGAVAIIELDGELLMLVGDWSNRHIDFYQVSLSGESKMLDFQQTSEIEMATYDKTGWIDPKPWPYQNINLIRYDDQLLLFGFSSGDGDTNLMDVYQLENPFSDSPILTKIFSKSFPQSSLTRFGWGAGVYYENEKFIIYSCGENILDQFIISRYSSH